MRTPAEPPRKRARLDKSVDPTKFTDGKDVLKGLSGRNQDELIHNLTSLRNRFTVRHDESSIAPDDGRLVLAKSWLELSPGAPEVFALWDSSKQASVTCLVISLLASVLTLLNSQYTYHTFGQPIIRTLLSPQYTQRLNTYLNGAHSESILVTLKLFNVLSSFAGGREKKAVLEAFAWESKSLPKLLNMRRKGKDVEGNDGLARPDIRTLYVLFIHSFVDPSASSSIKSTFLEQYRNVFQAVFKGLIQDSYSVVRRVLELCWTGIFSDSKLKRTLKVTLFNEITLSHIIKLYERRAPEGSEPDQVPADLVHHFLLAICARPGLGVCFKDRGWYPRESEEGDNADDSETKSSNQRGSKIYNKILLNLLKTLKPNEDPRQQELALKILAACPELVAAYWPAAALTLEPRLSSKWIANISFFGSVISLPVPVSSFHLPNSTLYQPTPPPLNTILENILPSVGIKSHLSKGLQSPSGLVQHCAALALVKCLTKYDKVISAFQAVEEALQENAEGQWAQRRRDVEREVRRRVPDFQVVVAFSQQKLRGEAKTGEAGTEPDPVKLALLSEVAQRLIWLYQRCLPSLVAEVRFDVGRLLQSFMPVSRDNEEASDASDEEEVEAANASEEGFEASDGTSGTDSADGDSDPSGHSGLQTLQQLHILRLLNETEQFTWTNKLDSTHSYLYALLDTYVNSEVPSLHRMIENLLRNVLSQSIMFQESPDEVHLWLAALPTTRRNPGTEAPDGAPLTDEGASVVLFLDDCIQRCMKVPYKYLEEMDNLLSPSKESSSGNGHIVGLLLATVLEQLSAKMDAELLDPSDTLAITTFLRKLCFNIATTLEEPELLLPVAQRIDTILALDRLPPDFPIMGKAIRREVSILFMALQRLKTVPPHGSHGPVEGNLDVGEFLAQVEQLPIPPDQLRPGAAYELVDWLRLLEESMSSDDLRVLVSAVKRLHSPAVRDLFQFLPPDAEALWDGLNFQPWVEENATQLDFEWLLIQMADEQLKEPRAAELLTELARPDSLLDLKRITCTLLQRARSLDSASTCLSVAARAIEKGRAKLNGRDLSAFKEYMFHGSEAFRKLSQSTSLAESQHQSLCRVLELLIDSKIEEDRVLVTDIVEYWCHLLRDTPNLHEASSASIWVPFMNEYSLLCMLDAALEKANDIELSGSSRAFMADLLDALSRRLLSKDVTLALRERLPRLLSLRSQIGFATVDNVLSALGEASLPLGYSGRLVVSDRSTNSGWAFSASVCDARFTNRKQGLLDTSTAASVLTRTDWSSTGEAVAYDLLYRMPSDYNWFLSVFSDDIVRSDFSSQILNLLDAFLDSSACNGSTVAVDNLLPWKTVLTKLLDHAQLEKPTVTHARAIFNMLEQCQDLRIELAAILQRHISSFPIQSTPGYVLTLGSVRIAEVSPEASASLLERALQWAVDYCSGDVPSTAEIDTVFMKLSHLIRHVPGTKSHIAEPVIAAAIKHRLDTSSILAFLVELVKAVHLKPVVVNRYLQSILQHPLFFRLCPSTSQPEGRSSREALINLIGVLFHSHPTNTCQASHIEPLVRVYTGSLSISDQRLFGIFRLFEETREMSVSSLLIRWSPLHDTVSSGALDAVQNLDANRVFRTCLSCSSRRAISGTEDVYAGEVLYDPIFLGLLISRILLDDLPEGALGWVRLLRTNVVCVVIRGLSSRDAESRRISLGQLSALYKSIEAADFQEKPHVIHIFNLLRGLRLTSTAPEVAHLPSYATLILAHALRAIFYPSNFIYPHTARFLLQRPALDIHDVPLLYGMLYGSSDEWKRERLWMIKYLADGLQSSQDWRVCKRRHTWDLLASLFQSSPKDRALRNAILEVLANATSIPEAATSLVTKAAILPWIEMQVSGDTRDEETVAFVKILENILVRADHKKAEQFTKGAWRSAICRALSPMLDKTECSARLLMFVVSVVLRLSLSTEGAAVIGLSSLLDKAFSWLLRLEADISITQSWKYPDTPSRLLQPPHRAQTLHIVPERDPVLVWGESVERLWRVSMTLPRKSPSWDGLTSRLLVWRAIVGPEVSPVGEWARREVVRNLSTS